MKGKLKSFFGAVGYLFIIFLIQLIVSVISGIIIALKNINEITTNGVNTDEIINKSTGLTNYILLASSIVTVVVFLLIYKARKKNIKEELQIVKTSKSNIIIGIGLGISAWLFNTGLISLVQESGLFKEYFSIMENMLAPLSEGSVLVSLLTVGIVVPFTEEFIFRGVIFKTLNKNISVLGTIIIQALFFGVFHGNLIQGIYTTLLGLVLGYITYRTRSLWSAIIIHMINNTIATISPFILKSVPSTTSILIAFIIIGSLGVTTLIYFINKKNGRYESNFVSIN